MKQKYDKCSSVVIKNSESHTSLAAFESESIIGQQNQEVCLVVQMAGFVESEHSSYANVKQILKEERVFAEIDVHM